jgi:surface antigen
VRRLLLGLAGVLLTGVVTVIPSAAHAETTLCVGTDVKSTMKCDPGWGVNMMFMHWRMYRGHNCTNYVAWRLTRDGVPEPSYLLGNAVDWAGRAKSHGVPVDSTPEVGAVGAWSGRNHVVYVDQVGSDFLLLTEDSYSLKKFRRYLVYKGERNYPTKFIHFQGKNAIRGATPSVSGKPEVGQTLKAAVGTWSPSGVKLSYQWLRDGVVIRGATGKYYRLVKADAGRRISISVTGTYAGKLPRTTSSLQTDAVSAGTIKPGTAKITGPPVEGQVLTASSTGWTPSDIAVNYQWFADGDPIKDASSRTFKLTKKQRGQAIVVRVTAYGPGYKAVPIKSAPTAKVVKPGESVGAVTAGKPTITGSYMVGERLTAKPGIWTPDAVKTTVQWLRNGVAVKDATAWDYRLTEADAGTSLRVDVVGTKTSYTTAKASSAATPSIKARKLQAVAAPTIIGSSSFMVGEKLTAKPGTWTPDAVKTTVQWLRNGVPIKDATTWDYRLTQADVGKSLRVDVVGTKSSYSKAKASSSSTPAIKKRQLQAITAPTMTGDTVVGSMLTVQPGTWAPSGVKTYIVWTRDGKTTGKRGATHVVAAGDVKHTIGAVVTAQRDGFDNVTRTVEAPKPIQAVPQFKTSWEKSKTEHAMVLKLSATALGAPIGGNVRITEDGRTKGLVKLWYGGPATWEFKGRAGQHSIRLTYEGADWLTNYTRAIGVTLP